MTVAAAAPASLSNETGQGWFGHLSLEYQHRGMPGAQRTELVRRRHQGPLLVQRSFHPEGPVCHSYIIHPPGGMVGGDRLQLDVDVGPEANVLITTPSAAKFYRSAGPASLQTQTFVVGDGATLDHLPAESILQGGCRIHLHNTFHLAATARLCAWDLLCLGRPGSGDHFENGSCTQDLRVERGGDLLLHERLHLEHGDPLLSRPWGLDGYSVSGLLLATPADEAMEQQLRDALDAKPDPLRGRTQGTPHKTGRETGRKTDQAMDQGVRLGITRRDGILLLRCLAVGAEPARRLLEHAWHVLRGPVMGLPPCPPRIWKT